MNKSFEEKSPTSKSERIVVDEIFGNGTVRLLKAKRLPYTSEDDLSIESWGEEEEDFQYAWLVETFVGYPSSKKLQEGDVFFVADGSKLNKDYKPIPRTRARIAHLLRSWDSSREIARNEIKVEFYKLSADRLSKSDAEKKRLYERIEKKVQAKKTLDNMQGGE